MLKAVFSFFNIDGLLKDSSMLFAGMAVVHVTNLLFQVVMGRCLEAEEYALLTALLGIFQVLTVPLAVVSSTVNRYSSLLVSAGRKGDVRRLLLYWLKVMMVPGAFLTLYCMLFPDSVADFIHLERVAPIYILGIVIMGAFVRPVFDGAMLGLQCFKAWSFSSIMGWGGRLVVGGVLVIFVSSYAGWGLLGHGLGFYLAMFCGAGFVFAILKNDVPSSKPLPKMHDYVLSSFFVLFGISFLKMGDVVLVKHLVPESAKEFSYAATLGRLVVFLPQAFVFSMFPKVVSDKGETSRQRSILVKTLLMTMLAAVAAATFFYFSVTLLLWLIYGISEPSAEMLRWSRSLTWIMVPISLLSVTVRYALAQRRLRAVFILPLLAICYALLSIKYGRSVDQVLMILCACALSSLLFTLVGVFGFWNPLHVFRKRDVV